MVKQIRYHLKEEMTNMDDKLTSTQTQFKSSIK